MKKEETKTITTTMSFAEVFLEPEILNEMTEDEKSAASKQIIDSLNETLLTEATPKFAHNPVNKPIRIEL